MKSSRLLVYLFVVSALAITFGVWHVSRSVPSQNRLLGQFLTHPIRKLQFWQVPRFQGQPLTERIYLAPPELIEYLGLDNEVNEIAAQPKAIRLPPDFVADIGTAMNQLPVSFLKKVDAQLIGIFIVENLGSSAYTEFLRTAEGQVGGALVVLDRQLLDRKANEWMTLKESSPFRDFGSMRILAQMEEAESDDRVAAIRYILSHEFAHVISYSVGAHREPKYESEADDPAHFGFARLGWKRPELIGKAFEPISQTAALRDVRYYGSPAQQMDAKKIPEIYQALSTTGFPTLYASTSLFDDWAESVANYIHTVVLKKPWKISIVEQDKVILRYSSCWQEVRCQTRRQWLEEFLKSE